MTFSFHPEAIAEYREAALRYENEKRGLGGQFVNAVEVGVAAILENPKRHGPVEQGVRRYALKRFPYRIHFVHDEIRRHVAIGAVQDGVRRQADRLTGLRRSLRPAPAFREGVNVAHSDASDFQFLNRELNACNER